MVQIEPLIMFLDLELTLLPLPIQFKPVILLVILISHPLLLSLNGGTIKDLAGNAATLTLASPGASGSLADNKAIVIDTTKSTVTNVTSSTSDDSYSAKLVIPFLFKLLFQKLFM